MQPSSNLPVFTNKYSHSAFHKVIWLKLFWPAGS